jgi:hypothetical protein
MASSGKKKTTMAKRARENKLRERRLDKQAKKEARKLASSGQAHPLDTSGQAHPLDTPGQAHPLDTGAGMASAEEAEPSGQFALGPVESSPPGARSPAHEPVQ